MPRPPMYERPGGDRTHVPCGEALLHSAALLTCHSVTLMYKHPHTTLHSRYLSDEQGWHTDNLLHLATNIPDGILLNFTKQPHECWPKCNTVRNKRNIYRVVKSTTSSMILTVSQEFEELIKSYTLCVTDGGSCVHWRRNQHIYKTKLISFKRNCVLILIYVFKWLLWKSFLLYSKYPNSFPLS